MHRRRAIKKEPLNVISRAKDFLRLSSFSIAKIITSMNRSWNFGISKLISTKKISFPTLKAIETTVLISPKMLSSRSAWEKVNAWIPSSEKSRD